MTPAQYSMLQRLARGGVVSGAAVSRDLGISRAAVAKHVRALRALGLSVSACPGRGYRLERPLDLLDPDRLAPAMARWDLALEFAPGLDSTNARLASRPGARIHRRVVLAEHQTAGRGRHGREWMSPPASGLCLSMGWRFQDGLVGLGPLGLVAGLAAAAAIARLCGRSPGVKWPNDVMAGDCKLGGCLVEIRGTSDGPCDAVVGVGLNVDMPAAFNPGRSWLDLRRWLGKVDRNDLALALAWQLAEDLAVFARDGFAPFRERWQRHDVLAGKWVDVIRPDGSRFTARAEGISAGGALQVATGAGVIALAAGEVSIRPAGGAESRP